MIIFQIFKTQYRVKPRSRFWRNTKTNQSILIACLCISIIIFALKQEFRSIVSYNFVNPKELHDAVEKYLHGSALFDDASVISQLHNVSNFQNCILCNNPEKHNKIKSNPNDLALTFGFGEKIHNFLTWLRNLRSTGCVCGVLIFIDKGYLNNFNKEVLAEIQKCGAFFIKLNSFEGLDARTLRTLVILSFLDTYRYYFDRIMINDIFDTYFQGDPFDEHLPRDKISLSVEEVTFEVHEWARKQQILTDDNYSDDFYNSKMLINGGVLIGPAIKMYELYLKMFDPKIFFREGVNDQSILNYVVYRSESDYFIDYDAKYLLSAAYSLFEFNPRSDNKMYQINAKHAPVLIHQFDRICSLLKNQVDKCQLIKSLGQTKDKLHGNPQRPRFDYVMQKCDASNSLTRLDG